MTLVLRSLSVFLLGWSALASAAITTSVVDLPTRGVTLRVLVVTPDNPVANVILIPGNDGLLGLDPWGVGGTELLESSPATRIRTLLAERGYAVAVVDAPADKATAGQMGGYRQSPQLETDVAAVADHLLARAGVPLWIVGDQSGATSALYLALNLPQEYRLGAVSISARSTVDIDLDLIRPPVLVVSHVRDECATIAQQTRLFEDLDSVLAKEHAALAGGVDQSGSCFVTYHSGYHLYHGLEAELVESIAGFVGRHSRAPELAPRNYQGLWYAAPAESESGWGINFAHQGDVIFATWFTYDTSGKAWWLTMTAPKVADGVYRGDLYTTTGAPFKAFVPPAVATQVGTGTLTFTGAAAGTFAYVVNGVAQTKSIVPQVFGPVPACAWGAQADLTQATNFQDLWWAAPSESESGWGVNLTQQGATIFATWFTYDANNNPLWLSVTAPESAANTFTGTLYLTTGPAFDAVPFNPSAVKRTPVGSATFAFQDGNNGTFDYDVDLGDGANKATQSKAITRQVFRAPGTTCTPASSSGSPTRAGGAAREPSR